MNAADAMQAKLAVLIERRRFLLRAAGVIVATVGLSACKHLGTPGATLSRQEHDGGGGGYGGGDGGSGGGAGGGAGGGSGD